MFKLNPVLLSLIAAQGMLFPLSNASAVELKPFTPEFNDNKVGAYCLCDGSTQTLSGLPRFTPGVSGEVSITLGELQRAGRIQSDNLIGRERVDVGDKNLSVGVPDRDNPDAEWTSVSVYDSDGIRDLTPIGLNTSVQDFVDVNDAQYIDARVASVGNGTLNIDIGEHGAAPSASSNSWSMAAKQSQLFSATRQGHLNWNSDNRITFTAATTPYDDHSLALEDEKVVTWAGMFTVTALDGGTSTFNVNSLDDLKNYNNWLIDQLSNGNLRANSYDTEFNKAFSYGYSAVTYAMGIKNYKDEITQPLGDQVVMRADGPNASVKINAGKTLEVQDSHTAAVRASNGATAIIDGKLATTGPILAESSGLELNTGATGINNGVINGGFFNNADGTGVDTSTLGYTDKAVAVNEGSQFTNNGVINLALGNSWGSKAIGLDNGSAINNGNINVGIADVYNSGNTRGTGVNYGFGGSFINAAGGTIYIGRTPQNAITDATSDVAVNLAGTVAAIDPFNDGEAINEGRIVIGSKVQNAVGIRIDGGTDTLALNAGVIDVNGRAQSGPAENIAMQAIDAGSGGRIGNTGTINLNGDNSTGIKVTARIGRTASVYSSGTINVNGDADAWNGTRNTAVWVTGLPGQYGIPAGRANADLTGPINLNGDAAIGIRAEGSATVNVSPVAVPKLSGGDYQIAFLAIGPDAKINLPANLNYASSGRYSTLFRNQDGADFDGTGLTLTASGDGSTAIVGSGGGTDIATHNAILNISPYGTGVLVEGGAQGTIDAATRFNLTGINAVAATADGDKHDLSMKATNPPAQPYATTSLTNHAAISSIYSGTTGLLALNQAQLVNTGNINLAGESSNGIIARYGANVTNSGDISVTRSGIGLYADGYPYVGDGTTPTIITNTGTLNVIGGTSQVMSPTYGAIAYNSLGRIDQNGTINLYGNNVVGANAFNGARINLGSESNVVFHDANQTAYQVQDADSSIYSSNGGSINVSTDGSTLYRATNGAYLYPLVSANVALNGANSTGVDVSGANTYAYRTDNYAVNGEGATAIRASWGAQAIISNPITLNGNNTLGASSSGDEADIYAASLINGGGTNITALDVSGASRIFNQYQGRVDLSGPSSTGVRAHDGGTFINRGYVHVASGTGVDISAGDGYFVPTDSELRVDDGIAALRVGSGAALKIYGDGQGASFIGAGGAADALLLDSGAQWLEANDIILTASGSGSALHNRAGTENISLQNVRLDVQGGTGIRSSRSFDADGSASVMVNGSGTGYLFASEDGSTTSNDLLIGPGYAIDVTGTGTGVRANTSGRVVSQGSINIADSNGGSAIVTSTASEVLNQGSITSQSVASPIIDLRGGQTVFINEGTITAPNPDTVVVAGGATNDVIALLDGKVVGDVDTGNGTDSLIMTGGTLNGSLTMGTGTDNQAVLQKVSLANTAHITTAGGTGSTLTLSDIEARGGSFAADNLSKGTNIGAGWSTLNFFRSLWHLTDNIKLAHSTINIDSGSTLFAGDNVNPVLQGATGDSLIVNNAGTLDLTNGGTAVGDTLTIDGDLASAGGRLRLNSNATQSDTLRVNGNVSGTTFIDETLRGGALADTNRNGVVDPAEGVSLAQVSGNASAGSFALQRGYVASGPWQYSLYSFAPGSSDASQRQVNGDGNAFWDYRLANTYVCEDGSLCQPQPGNGKVAARPAVTPQVPSYISAPVGLAYYQLAVTDDLHKRLGELRQQQRNPDALGGEMFIRYLGSNLTYQSNRGLSQYGYDVDLDYSAVQLGGNLLKMDGAHDSLRGGVAYTRGNTRIRPHAADGYSSTTFDSDSVALYGTWQRDNGLYLDGSLAWNWHRGETDIAREKKVASPKGNGWTASLESGYPFEFANGVRLEPQAQLTYLRLKMDSLTDSDRTRVSWDTYDQTIGRVGARLDRTWEDDSQRQYTPYLRTDYYRGWGGTAKGKVGSTESDASQNFNSGKFGQMWDAGIGGTTTFKNDVSLYAEADYRKEIDGSGAKGWRYNAGLRWSF